MSMVLFANCEDDIPEAIIAAIDFFYYQRRHGCAVGEDEIIGIVVGEMLHKNMPYWKSFNLEQGNGVLSDCCVCEQAPGQETDEGPVAIRSAFISGDAWALCTFDGQGLRNEPHRETRMKRIVALLREFCGESAWKFLPIYFEEQEMAVLTGADIITSARHLSIA
jgi:hypothetical protein